MPRLNPIVEEVRRQLIASALVRGLSIDDTAAEASCSYRYVQDLLREPSFVEHVNDLRRDAADALAARLADAAPTALGVAVAVMTDPTARDSDRLSAARLVLDATLRMNERLDELAAKVSASPATRFAT